jgi:hypothetical protein
MDIYLIAVTDPAEHAQKDQTPQLVSEPIDPVPDGALMRTYSISSTVPWQHLNAIKV